MKPSLATPLLARRTFLRRAASAAVLACGAPMIVPGHVLGAGGAVPPNSRVAVGFIGTGRQCVYSNIPLFLAEPDAQCVAVCDTDSWRMDKARRQIETHYAGATPGGAYKGCAAFRDWRDLLARKDIDAVMISTPDHWHVVQACAALRAGKDVACEKPLTRNIAAGRHLAGLVLKEGRVFRTDSEFRSLRTFHRAAQLVRNGRLGRLRRVITTTPKDSTIGPQPDMPVPAELDYDMWLGPAPLRPYTEKRVHPPRQDQGRPGWICIRDYADGMMANWGAHLNDIALWAMDADHTGPVSIEATGTFPPAGNLWDVVQQFEAQFAFASGVRLTCKIGKPGIRFEGDEGWIQIDYPRDIEMEPESLFQWKPGPKDIELPYKTSEKRDFLDAVKSRRQPLYDAEAGHRNNSLSHLALAAIQRGRLLSWDPEKEEILGDPEAARLLAPKPPRAPWTL